MEDKNTKNRRAVKILSIAVIILSGLLIILLAAYLNSFSSKKVTTEDVLESQVKNVIKDSLPSVFSIFTTFSFSHVGSELESERTGSGVAFLKEKGNVYVLTNFHVVENAVQIRVIDSEQREIFAELIGSDPLKDIAVLKIKDDNRVKTPVYSEKLVEPGTFVLALGSPFEFDQSATFGIVSANKRSLSTKFGYQISGVIQTDASVNQGNSGGPLFNLKGEVVGINTAIFSTSGGFEGISFAIPAQEAKRVAEKIIEEGEAVKNAFGITCADFDKSVADSFELPVDGVLILCLDPNSPIAEAGIKATRGIPGHQGFVLGDIITEVEGRRVRTMKQLAQILADLDDKEVRIEIYSAGEFREVIVEIP